jgi:hypothetical protein
MSNIEERLLSAFFSVKKYCASAYGSLSLYCVFAGMFVSNLLATDFLLLDLGFDFDLGLSGSIANFK